MRILFFLIIFATILPGINADSEFSETLIFTVSKTPKTTTIDQVLNTKKSYVTHKIRGLVANTVNNAEAKTSSNHYAPFYRFSDITEKEEHFCLGNIDFIEAILAQGHHLNAYCWLTGKDKMPLKGIFCTITGYNHNDRQFHVRMNGKDKTLPYEFISENIQFAEITNSQKTNYTWNFTPMESAQTFSINASTLDSALKELRKQYKTLDKPISVQVAQARTTQQREKIIRLGFGIKIVKTRVNSPKNPCGHYYWPAGHRTARVKWDEERYGQFDGFELGKPMTYPTALAKYYVHNGRNPSCVCRNITVLGAWLRVVYENGTLYVNPLRWSTCNIYDNITNSATIGGTVNCYALK